MITVRCKQCNRELQSNSKTQVCGCSNMVTVKGDKVSALDLSKVVMINSDINKSDNILTNQDLAFQEERKKRKIRRLDFEVK